MRTLTALVLSSTIQLASAQANYTKTAEIPPLRVAFADLQSVLDKTEKLLASANAGAKPQREELALKSGATRVTIPGRTLAPQNAKIPDKLDSLTYSYLLTGQAPITRVDWDFSDYRRTLTVTGDSPEQVDAIFTATREDLTNISSAIGGTFIKSFLTFPAYYFLIIIIGWCGAEWRSTRSATSLRILISAACVVLLLTVLPIDDLLAGFLAIRGESSFMIRYGPQISFIGLALAALPILLSVTRFLRPVKNNNAPDVALAEQPARPKAGSDGETS